MKHRGKLITASLMIMVLILSQAMPTSASVSPSTLEATLSEGEYVEETKTVTFDVPEDADVVFAFDLTSSMSGIITAAKTNAGALMTELDTWGLAKGISIDYGVMSYMDYDGYYSSCGYSAQYGDSYYGDYPYMLDQAVTGSNANVSAAITGLTIGWGADGPQDYTRIFYESYADAAVAWRTDAERILLNFGDNVPHDCNLNEDVPGETGTWSTGVDPGRDAVIGGGDDLDLQTVLADMASNDVKLLESHSHSGDKNYWDYWTGITGGKTFITSSSTWLTSVGEEIKKSIAYAEDLHFEAESGYEAWLTSEHKSDWMFDPMELDITITVPSGTPLGTHVFTLTAVDAYGNEYGEQEVTIDVVRMPVQIDIKPGSFPNTIKLSNKGVVPVGILGSVEFDVRNIDIGTVTFSGGCGAQSEEYLKSLDIVYEDVNGDGLEDLVLHFKTTDTGILVGDTEATLFGSTLGGAPFEGTDSVRTIPKW